MTYFNLMQIYKQNKNFAFPHKIGKTIYFVESSPSRTATDTIESKVEKLILRECERNSK